VDGHLGRPLFQGQLDGGQQVVLVTVDAARRQQAHDVDAPAAFASTFHGVEQGGVAGETAVLDCLADASQLLVDDATGTDIEVSDLGIAHLTIGQADRFAGSVSRLCGLAAHSRSQLGVRPVLMALSGAASRWPQPSRISKTRG
jgi:hypothetical protein